MSYVKQNFQSGDVLTAESLNQMDDEIESVSNAIEQGSLNGDSNSRISEVASETANMLTTVRGKYTVQTEINGFWSVSTKELNNDNGDSVHHTRLVPTKGFNRISGRTYMDGNGYAIAYFDDQFEIIPAISIVGTGNMRFLESEGNAINLPSTAAYVSVSGWGTATDYPIEFIADKANLADDISNLNSSKLDKVNPIFSGYIMNDELDPDPEVEDVPGLKGIAIGRTDRAYGDYSQAFGELSEANGDDSYVSGFWLLSVYKGEHVFGKYNDYSHGNVNKTNAQQYGPYVEIVGNGTGANPEYRSNARTLDWNGNEKLAGSLTLGMGTVDAATITPAQLKALLNLIGGGAIEIVPDGNA